jgi:hypothetical protein
VADLSYILHNNSPYNDCWKSLKETSFDEKNKIYLCQSDMMVFDFDCIVKALYPKKQPASYDALIVNQEDKLVYCVEFKNQKPSEIDKRNITVPCPYHERHPMSDAILSPIGGEENSSLL